MSRFKNLSPRSISVSTKIALGFSIVLALHISIAVLGHYGLSKADADRERRNDLNSQVETFYEIDRLVGEMQHNVLLFAFSGFNGPELRAKHVQNNLGKLLERASGSASRTAGRMVILQMRRHLETHREIFDTVVVDRAKCRQLIDDELIRCGRNFDHSIRQVTSEVGRNEALLAADASFRTAQLHAMKFVNSPDSAHVRDTKRHLASATESLKQMRVSSGKIAGQVGNTMTTVADFEAAFIQMVQVTRGYLHLVNVILAGEAEEFLRLAGDVRQEHSRRATELSTTMAADSKRFQNASNIFSAVTIVLGLLASWLIGRDVSSRLDAIASTFDGLTRGQTCESIPGLKRNDEFGRLASAAQVFKDKAAETERLLRDAEIAKIELNAVNQQLESQSMLAKAMAAEATAATRAKSEFLANMSHEIRTPLTAILGYTDMLTDYMTDPENVAAADTIRRNGEHLLGIINDILDLSQVEAGSMKVERIRYCPRQIVADAAALMMVKADSRGISLATEVRGRLPATILTDPTRLRQILINLIGNAIKFTEVGGVRVVTRCIREDDRDVLQFDVVDTGLGMTEEQVSNLFQPFSQADSSTKRRFGGTGLGLTISKRFAKMLGGDITVVETQLEHGSRFRLTVSADPAEVQHGEDHTLPADVDALPASQSIDEKIGLQGCRVLLAEDGPDNQRLLSFVLKKAGAEVHVEENGLLAMQVALAAVSQSQPFDCILMDMQMPVMDGYEASRALREQGYRGSIVALTAHAMDGDRQKCIESGCNDYTTKPIDRAVLLSKVFEWSRANRPEQQPAATI